ncbi:MAG: hypothetical protein LBU56_02405 [Rickettsiales bacterium]|jgi:hypothetical protein|nr:hypothetical protein [Rickettsiales bacterium]
MMQSHKYAKINALWFVPIINIVYALIFGLAISSNFWSANFSMLLVGVGNSIAFAIYYIRQRYRKRKFNNQLEFEFQRSKVVKIKPFIMIGTISFLSIVTVIINMVVKSNFGLEFTPYILSDIIFLIGIVGVYCAVLVLYYFKYDASIKSLALGAIISFSYSNIIFAVFAPMLSLHEQLDIVSIEIWHLYAVNIALIIVNVISITIYHLWNYHSKKGLSKADEIY